MNTRDEILSRVRRGQPSAMACPDLPPFARGELTSRAGFDAFGEALQRMGGRLAQPLAGRDLSASVAALFPDAKVICSAAPEVAGNRPLASAVQRPAALEDVDLGIVRAGLGVAETGSVLLTEVHLQVEAIAFLPQHLLVLLDPAQVVPTLHDVYRHPAFGAARYVVLLTGPSATADIEGVLIHGAQGVRSLTVLPWPEPVAMAPGDPAGTGPA